MAINIFELCQLIVIILNSSSISSLDMVGQIVYAGLTRNKSQTFEALYSGGFRISQKGTLASKEGINLLFGQIFPKTA